MSRLPIKVVTLLSPNWKLASPTVFSKKFGDQPKSSSKPTTLGFQPRVAPKSTRFSTSSSKSLKSSNVALPPKFPPTNGEKNQPCACAVAGTSDSASALMMKIRELGLYLLVSSMSPILHGGTVQSA